MTPARTAAAVLGLARIAYDVSLIAAPARIGAPWIGQLSERPAAQLTLRALATRDLAVNSGIAIAALTGAPVRPWLAAAVIGDTADVLATFAARGDVPDKVPAKLVGVGGGSAALSAALFAWIDG